MRLHRMAVLAGSIALAATLAAQPIQIGQPADTKTASGSAEKIPLVEVSLGYTYLLANAPPGKCQCFSLNGGYGSAAVKVPLGFSIVGDLSAAHAGNITGTTQSLTVLNYLFGPRYSWRAMPSGLSPYAQVLLGGSTQLGSSPPIQNVSAFAFSIGGGMNAKLTHLIGWKIVELDWLQSHLPNAVNNRQNDLRIDSGLVFRF